MLCCPIWLGDGVQLNVLLLKTAPEGRFTIEYVKGLLLVSFATIEKFNDSPCVTVLFPILAMVRTEIVGTALTETVVDWEAVAPPFPVQFKVYVEFWVGVIVADPEVDLVPDHAPEAVQLVAFDADQVKVVDWPE